MAIVPGPLPGTAWHDADALQPLKQKGKDCTSILEADSSPCPAHCLNRSFEQQAGVGTVLGGAGVHRRTSLGIVSLLRLLEGFSEHDDKRRHRTFHRAFRTLSLASPPAFVDSALVPGALGAVKSVLKEPTGLPPASQFVLRDGVNF